MKGEDEAGAATKAERNDEAADDDNEEEEDFGPKLGPLGATLVPEVLAALQVGMEFVFGKQYHFQQV